MSSTINFVLGFKDYEKISFTDSFKRMRLKEFVKGIFFS